MPATRPNMPGSFRSARRLSGASLRVAANAVKPSSAVLARYPASASKTERISPIAGSLPPIGNWALVIGISHPHFSALYASVSKPWDPGANYFVDRLCGHPEHLLSPGPFMNCPTSRKAWLATTQPSSSMSPNFSMRPINPSGKTSPRWGCLQRARASTPMTSPLSVSICG